MRADRLSKYCLIIFLLVLVKDVKLRNVYELLLECPLAANYHMGEITLHGSVVLPPINVQDVSTLEIESSCSMDVHNSGKTAHSLTELTWNKKADHSGNAAESSFEFKSAEKSLKGICKITHKTVEQAYKLHKSVICYDLICNQTMCKPELHFLSQMWACTSMRSCVIAVGPHRVQVTFKKTFCSTGVVVEGRCFRPDRTTTLNKRSTFIEYTTLPLHCFLVQHNNEKQKLVAELEKLKTDGCTSNTHAFQGYYLCVTGGSTELIKVPTSDDERSQAILKAIFKAPYGEDHDNMDEPFGAIRIAGSGNGKVPSTETADNIKGVAFSGTPMYSSLSVFTKKQEGDLAFSPGILINYNHTGCDSKALPLVWSGYTTIPGVFESINQCSVFCVLSGPGASCDAFAEGGIYNLTSPTCLVSKHTFIKSTEQQVTFVCQRLDTDIIVYCNGQKKTILTRTLVIGQCIYTLTSIFSLLPSVAHSIAIELCVPGFHGWATIALIITFCFGWLLIPSITWLILFILKFSVRMVRSYTEENSFKTLLRRIRDEYERTKGSMVCDVCKTECETQKELKSHQISCSKEQCPYCFTHCEPSEIAFQAHYKVCQVTNRFSDDLKKTITQGPMRPGCYRTLNLFRYRSRCYIFTVWMTLLIIESILWAASAEPDPLKPNWVDTAHGIGHYVMLTDLELDFSLLSSSQYTYRRKLVSASNPDDSTVLHIEIDAQLITAEIQPLGHWYDAMLNVKTSFHCYGACNKYTYPWQSTKCFVERDFQYESSWGCNPVDCPGIGTGCTACGLYLDKFKPVGTAYKIVNLRYTRHVCVQFSDETMCKVIESNDCFIAKNFKICLIGTVTKFQNGDTLLFLGPLEAGGIILKQWCTTNCQYGDPGDIMLGINQQYSCPDYIGAMRKRCVFGHTPVCEYNGNLISGYRKLIATIDSFQSFNVSNIHISQSSLEWADPDGLLKDHINVLVNRDINFEDLAENPCRIQVQTINIEGAWGSGVGFTVKCIVSLTECPTFLTSIKACDAAICYGAASVKLIRGQNTVRVTGKGGHSGSKFRCCHEENCSPTGLLAAAPHLDRVSGVDALSEEKVFDDGAPSCKVKCWLVKTGEWLRGLLSGNWMVVIVLVVTLFISIVCMTIFCPVRKIKRG
ncbi:glycoprotein precursor [Jeju virus]|uniref:Envelopment polyprotein n=3 Tax=Jeju virus TaxID=990280 RepID=H8XZP4_9VIRU|nr:glycoprotein precursor [Jeju virus]AEX56232.1 glycoprotein precursor [Jeju virus]